MFIKRDRPHCNRQVNGKIEILKKCSSPTPSLEWMCKNKMLNATKEYYFI